MKIRVKKIFAIDKGMGVYQGDVLNVIEYLKEIDAYVVRLISGSEWILSKKQVEVIE